MIVLSKDCLVNVMKTRVIKLFATTLDAKLKSHGHTALWLILPSYNIYTVGSNEGNTVQHRGIHDYIKSTKGTGMSVRWQ